MEKILLTGGSGFIGKNFIQQRSDHYQISAPNRSQLELTNQTQVKKFFHEKQFSCIIHAATVGVSRKSQLEPLFGLNANLRAFAHIFAERNKAERFIYLGSGAEYGRPLSMRQIDEAQLGNVIPDDEYGFAKLLSSSMLASQPNKKAVTLHLFGVYGPHEDYRTRFISNAIVRTLFGLPIVLHQNVEFDYVYIHDFLKILDEFIHRPAFYSNYNITTGNPVTLLEIAETIKDLVGNKQKIIVKKPGMGSTYTGANQRLKNFLSPSFQFTPLKEAILELANWYQTHMSALNRDWVACEEGG